MQQIPVFSIPTGSRTREQICAKLEVYDRIIAAYEAAIERSATKAEVFEYEIRTGQTSHRVERIQPQHLADSLLRWEELRERLANKLTPRTVKLVSPTVFRRR